VPGVVAPAVPTAAAGSAYLSPARGPSSRRILDIQWTHPVHKGARKEGEGTQSSEQRKALPAAEAMRYIAGKDKRPLLILRECLTCTGTEDALLTRESDNERTYLLSQWFHCVKLPPDVLEDDHPFRNLFAGDTAAHLFVCNADGSGRTNLSGSKMRSRKALWDAMESAMKSNYRKSPRKPLRTLTNLLDDLDQIDLAVSELETKLELAIAKDGPEDRRTKKLMKKMTALRAERTELYEEVAEAAKLQLKPEVTKSDLDPPADEKG